MGTKLALGPQGDGADAEMSVTDAIEDYLLDARKLSPKTRRWYRQRLDYLARWCEANHVARMGQLDGRALRRFFESMADAPTLGEHSQRGIAQVVRQWLRWCGREGYCPRDLHDRVRMPKVEQRVIPALGKGHVNALFDACKREPYPMLAARNAALLATLLSTGIRAAEACGLTVADVHTENPDDAYLLVRHGKGGKQREVGLAFVAVRYLRRYVRVRRAHAGVDALFVNQKGQPLTPSGLNQLLSRLQEWAGLPDQPPVNPHNLRRSFAVWYMAQEGADSFKLKELMGHASIQTTLLYLRDYKQRDARRGMANPLDTLMG